MAEVIEEGAVSACPVCDHRALWHHDERGCQYHGNGYSRCPCRRTCDQVVAQVISRAMHAAADQWFDAIITGVAPDVNTTPGSPGADQAGDRP